MIPTRSVLALALIVVILGLIQQVKSQHVFVVAPNTLRLGTPETVVVYSHSGVQEVTVSLTDLPGKKNEFFKQQVKVVDNNPQTLVVQVNPEHIPDLNITGTLDHHYVLLQVKGKNFNKETKILVTLHAGYVFLQTDKPIYTPKQTVNVRIIRLGEDMVSDNQTFTFQIRNPQNTIVDSVPNSKLRNLNGMYNYIFTFPTYPMMGEWSVVVLYGLKIKLNSTVKFELKEYVLPTFEVQLKTPEIIFPDEEVMKVSAIAKYVYGKNVEGKAIFKLHVKLETGHVEHFGNCEGKRLFEGEVSCSINTTEVKKHKKIGWFPAIKGARLLVEALIFEESSGFKENATSDSTVFSDSAYVVSFHKSLADYKPGLNTVVQAQISHVNGKPAPNVGTTVQVRDHNNNVVQVDKATIRAVSNEEGIVAFVIKSSNQHQSLKVTVETEGGRHPSKGHHMLFPYRSTGGSYIGISRDNTLLRKVGDSFIASVYTHPNNDIPLSYLVTSKGKIIVSGSLLVSGRNQRSLDFRITDEMVPSARVVIFGVYGGQLLTDSLKFRVERVCKQDGAITVETDNLKQPGDGATIKVKGKPNTAIGIIAVDKAVYALRNKDKLTSDSMFDEMDRHDMGCGPGGGLDSAAVLANAGLLIVADTVSITNERKSCLEKKLRKRSIRDQITQDYGMENEACCEVGKLPDRLARTCEDRADIISNFEGNGLDNKESCARVFLKCCQEAEAALGPIKMKSESGYSARPYTLFGARTGAAPLVDELDFPNEKELDELIADTRERRDFRETWLFDSAIIGPSGVYEQTISLPDSITTWIVQAVGLSGKSGGMCVAKPSQVVAFREVFLDVRVPYSVVKNEQIEIPVTVFNYGNKRLPILLYTYGVEGLCSEAQPGEKSDRKRIYVNGPGAETVAFQMIPLEAKEFSLKFSAMSTGGSDTVVKKLLVIAEGVVHEEFFPIVIDPSNTEKRKRRNIMSENLEVRFDNENKRQVSRVKLVPEFEFVVPGTESVVIDGIGDKFGPTIQTSLENPDGLLQLPRGCGEQTMAFMAPTVYTLHYLKATGKVTPTQETNAYKFIRNGYVHEQTFRKKDGSYAAWIQKPSSTWLTAFVGRVFCQASRYIFVDETVMCSAVEWLGTKQKADGAFVESEPIIHRPMMGGVNGDVAMTAFVVITYEQCECKTAKVKGPLEKAVKYLQEKIPILDDHYRVAIATYALALHDTELAVEANNKLIKMASYDPDLNTRYWGDGKSAVSVEASSYALLTQVLLGDVEKATSIVNWLNTQRRIGGSFWSTQDTVAAIEALAEYAILARDPDISLSLNISSTSDPSFKHSWQFRPDNARVRRQVELNKLGGRLVVEAQGSGAGLFGVKLRYNVANSADKICKFDVKVEVSNAVERIDKSLIPKAEDNFDDMFAQPMAKILINELGLDPPKENKTKLQKVSRAPPKVFASRQNRPVKAFSLKDMGLDEDAVNAANIQEEPRLLWKRDLIVEHNPPMERSGAMPSSSKMVLNITICTRYLGDKETDMAIVDVGMLTGYKAMEEDLKKLVRDETSPIDRFEENGRNLIFYFDKISNETQVCFSFRSKREFIASNLESGLVRVYDYYEPNQACSQFYRSENVGPVLDKVCFDNVCKCAEGGCPPKEPFANVYAAKGLTLKRKRLMDIACSQREYFWRVKVIEAKKEISGYIHYTMKVMKVIKEGLEKRDDVEDDIRQFIARVNCASSILSEGVVYYILGRDQEPREVNGEIKYIYFIDKTTLMQKWVDVTKQDRNSSPLDRKRQSSIFGHVEKLFASKQGCND